MTPGYRDNIRVRIHGQSPYLQFRIFNETEFHFLASSFIFGQKMMKFCNHLNTRNDKSRRINL